MNCSKATEFHRKSGQGLGLNSEYDLSAVGAALNLGPLAPVLLGEAVTLLISTRSHRVLNEFVIPTGPGFPATHRRTQPRVLLSLRKAA
jgi:hypothetical protein